MNDADLLVVGDVRALVARPTPPPLPPPPARYCEIDVEPYAPWDEFEDTLRAALDRKRLRFAAKYVASHCHAFASETTRVFAILAPHHLEATGDADEARRTETRMLWVRAIGCLFDCVLATPRRRELTQVAINLGFRWLSRQPVSCVKYVAALAHTRTSKSQFAKSLRYASADNVEFLEALLDRTKLDLCFTISSNDADAPAVAAILARAMYADRIRALHYEYVVDPACLPTVAQHWNDATLYDYMSRHERWGLGPLDDDAAYRRAGYRAECCSSAIWTRMTHHMYVCSALPLVQWGLSVYVITWILDWFIEPPAVPMRRVQLVDRIWRSHATRSAVVPRAARARV